MNDGHVMSLFWNKGEPGACAGRHGLHAESLHRLTDHWTHNEVIPSSRTIPVELIMLCFLSFQHSGDVGVDATAAVPLITTRCECSTSCFSGSWFGVALGEGKGEKGRGAAIKT